MIIIARRHKNNCIFESQKDVEWSNRLPYANPDHDVFIKFKSTQTFGKA